MGFSNREAVCLERGTN